MKVFATTFFDTRTTRLKVSRSLLMSSQILVLPLVFEAISVDQDDRHYYIKGQCVKAGRQIKGRLPNGVVRKVPEDYELKRGNI